MFIVILHTFILWLISVPKSHEYISILNTIETVLADFDSSVTTTFQLSVLHITL